MCRSRSFPGAACQGQDLCELYRKTRQLEQLNSELEQRVTERTAERSRMQGVCCKRAPPELGFGRGPNGLLGLGSR